jgi:hypothetical protein
MYPEKQVSPVYNTYRAHSILKITCKMTATVVIQRIVGPYRADKPGPINHSPLPMDMLKAIVPGPTTARTFLKFIGGGAGRSALPQSGI